LYGAETWTLWKLDWKDMESLKCAGEGLSRSVGLIVREMKKYYKEPRTNNKKKKGSVGWSHGKDRSDGKMRKKM
jgi:hypothetical protein